MSDATPTPPPPTRPPATRPPKSTAPPPQRPTASSPANAAAYAGRQFGTGVGVIKGGKKIVIYGPGGVGKTELCSLVEHIGRRPIFIDLEDSTADFDVERVEPSPETFEEVRHVLHDRKLLENYDTIIVDSLTKLEELATDFVVRTVKHEKGHYVDEIEGFGFGKGYTHVYSAYLTALGDLDALYRAGKWIICTAHECTAPVPNPAGEDWIRYEPRLQSPTSGKSSIRHKVKEWCGHLFYIGFDTAVSKDGKAKGAGTRTVYPVEMPTHWAKSRTLIDPVPYYRYDPALWQALTAGEGAPPQ